MIRSVGKSYRKIRTAGRKLARVAATDVAAAIGAESLRVGDSSVQGPLALFGLRQALAARLKSSGGRPSLGVSRRQKIPLDDADWELLCRLAETLADDESRPTPGQVASELLHQRLAELRLAMGPQLRPKPTGTE
jgi:hypothetical protein